MTTRPACHRTTNPAFIHPAAATQQQQQQAIATCQTCPILQDCARKALHAGAGYDYQAEVDDNITPAVGVIQAGVICYDDDETLLALYATAGLTPPPDLLIAPTRATAPDHCINCGRPMVRWNRHETQPEGYVMHYAHGHCTGCRSALKRWKAENNIRPARRSRVQTDRTRHSAPPRKTGEVTVQLALFSA